MISLFRRIRFWLTESRIGPDMPMTHWMLQFPGLGRRLAERKFRSFGEGSSLRPNVYAVRTDCIDIGERVVIRPQTILMANDLASIRIGSDVLIGSGAHFYASNHRFDRRDQLIADQGHSYTGDLVIEDDVWIGANALIMPGVRVGRHSVIAAGSVVTKSVEPYSLYAGVPAHKIKEI
ncbi:acyltransferase [Halomonas tibetensis]|uniref:Acyltransferase n=1 Tax=Halomonas tibetensis TaxID=2259590 RepID=A0ABV7B547_9GAMM